MSRNFMKVVDMPSGKKDELTTRDLYMFRCNSVTLHDSRCVTLRCAFM
jgi:hypothetical protein